MTVIDDGRSDRYGNCPIIFKSCTPKQIHEWLFDHYQGYKFAIVFDETKDEYEEMSEYFVYFLDCILTEAADYSGKKIVNA